jgi:hypothetical protein
VDGHVRDLAARRSAQLLGDVGEGEPRWRMVMKVLDNSIPSQLDWCRVDLSSPLF